MYGAVVYSCGSELLVSPRVQWLKIVWDARGDLLQSSTEQRTVGRAAQHLTPYFVQQAQPGPRGAQSSEHASISPRAHAAPFGRSPAPLVCNSLICCHLTRTSSGFPQPFSSSSPRCLPLWFCPSFRPQAWGVILQNREEKKKSKAAECWELTVHFFMQGARPLLPFF